MKTKRSKIILIAIVCLAALVCILAGAAWYAASVKNVPPTTSSEYTNTQYGFSVSLPESWKGYSIVTDAWNGTVSTDTGPTGDTPVIQGPLISIRNPAWTAEKPYQDIPVMVFTLAQWDDLLRRKFMVSPAPVNPSPLGFNATYVFALPARYNYAFPAGYEEVDKILQNNPLQPLPGSPAISNDGKVLLCGGIPNGSTQNVIETTRLFINLPKDVYPDKEHNLQPKTISGNVTAGRMPARDTGEDLEATLECWSYRFDFNGIGEVDLTAKSGIKNAPDYVVRFIVRPNPQDIITAPTKQ